MTGAAIPGDAAIAILALKPYQDAEVWRAGAICAGLMLFSNLLL
jgi:hypothetical protein